MKHCIIAKFNDSVDDKAAMITRIDKLFAPAPAMDGIHGCTVLRNCIDRENRYDLAIIIDMDKAALPAWDASELHREWKSGFGSYLAAKAIFDFELSIYRVQLLIFAQAEICSTETPVGVHREWFSLKVI